MNDREICDTFKNHGERITKLEIRDAEQSVKIDNLVASLKNLTGWIKALVITILTGVLGFGFWLIQYLITKP